MSKIKAINIAEAISEYDDKFINSITLKDITSYSEFRDLMKTLERANHIVTEYYMMLYNDYMILLIHINHFSHVFLLHRNHYHLIWFPH